jgi:hypothetical protein
MMWHPKICVILVLLCVWGVGGSIGGREKGGGTCEAMYTTLSLFVRLISFIEDGRALVLLYNTIKED